MTKMRPCPDCLALEAFRKRVEKSGRKWITSNHPCPSCNGSGKVKEAPSRDKKRRKDMSGDEWTQEDSAAEWNQYLMERKDD